MGWVQVGSCPKCGAPMYSESPWFAVTPPPVKYTCMCVPQPKYKTISHTTEDEQ